MGNLAQKGKKECIESEFQFIYARSKAAKQLKEKLWSIVSQALRIWSFKASRKTARSFFGHRRERALSDKPKISGQQSGGPQPFFFSSREHGRTAGGPAIGCGGFGRGKSASGEENRRRGSQKENQPPQGFQTRHESLRAVPSPDGDCRFLARARGASFDLPELFLLEPRLAQAESCCKNCAFSEPGRGCG